MHLKPLTEYIIGLCSKGTIAFCKMRLHTDNAFRQQYYRRLLYVTFHFKLNLLISVIYIHTICEASLQKGPEVAKKIEIFVDHNRTGDDKSVKKNWRSSTNIYEVMADLRIHNYIIYIIIKIKNSTIYN